MSTAKRSRQSQPEVPVSAQHPAKRAKTAGLAFLTDERQRSGKIITAKTTNGVDAARLNRVDESKTAISGQDAANDDEDDDVEDNDSEAAEPDSSAEDTPADADVVMANGDANHTADLPKTNGVSKPLTNGVSDTDADAEDNAAPSFGELLQAAHPEIIDVTASLDGPVKSQTSANTKALQAPSSNSLGTVLTQALRTNDKELLESCLQTKDIATIKSTIQRLQSNLVANLMQKLAERLHKRPGRAGPLMVWIQWSLVTHGGYLAGQPQVVKQLKALRQVVKERAGSLQSLITLKGKLDLLGAQVELRRSMRSLHRGGDDSDESDDDLVYVEGEDVESSSDEDDAVDLKLIQQTPRKVNGVKPSKTGVQSDDEMDGDIPLINGIDDDAEMESMAEEDDEDEEEVEKLIDDEAEESEVEESMSSEEDASESGSDAEADDQDDSSSEDEAISVVPQTSRPNTRRAALLRKR